MGLKIIIPVAGVAGTIAGAIGASNTTLRSKKAAVEVPHEWAIQPIETIGLISRCSKDEYTLEGRKNYYTFRMFSSVKGEDSNKLVKDKKVDLNLQVEFRAEAGWDELTKFTPEANKEVSLVLNYNDDETFHVILSEQGTDRGGEGDIKFFCLPSSEEAEKFSWLNREESDKQIYFAKMKSSEQAVLVSKHDEGNKVRVKLGNCDRLTDKKITTCELKLSDLAENKWNIKVSEKAKLTFSK